NSRQILRRHGQLIFARRSRETFQSCARCYLRGVIVAQYLAIRLDADCKAVAVAQNRVGFVVAPSQAERSRQQPKQRGLRRPSVRASVFADCGLAPGRKRGIQLKDQKLHGTQPCTKAVSSASDPSPVSTLISYVVSAQGPYTLSKLSR